MSLNKLMLIGHVGKDPDIRILEAGSKVATFSFATTEKGYTLANGTQDPERTEWHNIVVWRGLADVVEKYVHKGDKLYLEGKIRTRSYTDQAGATRYTTEIYVDNMEMLTPKGTNPGAGATASMQQPVAASVQQPQQSQQSQAQSIQDNSADDLPF